MRALDQLVVRVVRRYVAAIERRQRIAVEYQRRSWGLERVEHEDECDAVDDEASTEPGTARRSSP
jgi:hypothetical protein